MVVTFLHECFTTRMFSHGRLTAILLRRILCCLVDDKRMNGKEPVCCNTKNVYTRCIGIAATLCLILFLGQTFVSHSSLAFVQVFSHDRGITLAEEEQRIRRQFCNKEPVPPSANSVEDLLCKVRRLCQLSTF